MKFNRITQRPPERMFLDWRLLTINTLAPAAVWHDMLANGGQARPMIAWAAITLTFAADAGFLLWLYMKLNERCRERLEAGIAGAMDAVIGADHDGQIRLFNPAAEAVFGYRRGEMIGRPVDVLVPARHRAVHRRLIARLLDGGAPHTAFGRDRIVLAVRAGGEEFPVEGFVSKIGEGRELMMMFIVRDVSLRRRALVQLERLAAVVEASSDAIISHDLNGTITTWNPAAQRIYGYTAEEIVGQPISRLAPPTAAAQQADVLTRVRRGERVECFHTVRRRSDALRINVSVSIAPLRDETGRVVGACNIARDISSQSKAARAQAGYLVRLQELSRRLMETEERQRRRIASELHDCTGSNLTAVATCLELIRASLPDEARRSQDTRFAECQLMLRECVNHLRDLLADLRPTALDLGLLAALRHHGDRLRCGTGLAIRVEGNEPRPRLRPDTEIAMFRIAQEAINNALKHGAPHELTITLAQYGGFVRLVVCDDGDGFEVHRVPSSSGSLGMTTMRERAQAIGAVLSVVSAPGRGTRVSVAIEWPATPVPKE